LRRLLPFLLLTALGLAVLVWPERVYDLVGFKPLHAPSARDLDEPAAPDDRKMPQFLAERNEVRVTVREATTLADFLRVNQLAELPHVRREIARAEGAADDLPDDHLLAAGKTYVLHLTPPAEGAP
jgi:hypothetical protein